MGIFASISGMFKRMDEANKKAAESCFTAREPIYDWKKVISIAETILDSTNTTQEQKHKANKVLSRAYGELSKNK